MKEDNNLTPIQKAVIKSEGSNMLVSASAGSGKTFVMIERVIRLITEGKADVGDILALTFTNLAAEEMKQKLVNAIIGEIAKGNNVERMKNALAEIPTASISTFHSFCSDLLKKYFYVAKIDPLYAIADDADAKELKKRAIDQLFLQKYSDGDEDFLYLTRIYRKNRSDETLKKHVLDLLSFASSESDPEAYLKKTANSVTEDEYYKIADALMELYKNEMSVFIKDFQALKSEYDLYESKKYSEFLGIYIARLKSARYCDDIRKILIVANEPFENVPRTTKADGECVKELGSALKTLTSKAKTLFSSIIQDFDGFGEKGKEVYLASARATKALCLLTIDFNNIYSEIKADENKLDFSDLEQKTRQLLLSSPEICEELKQKYKYVFADEYQDVNAVQEEILSLIYNDNAFMVGDVKQSIYAFRGCNPEIFSNKFDDYKKNHGGIVFSLDKNFRSSDKILDGVNLVFSRIMTKDFGDIAYAENPMTFGELFPKNYGGITLHVIDGKAKRKSPSTGVYDILKSLESAEESEDFLEGSLIANIIEDELSKKIYDPKLKEERNVELKDIVILARTAKGFIPKVVKELLKRNIPAVGDMGSSLTDYPEIQLLISVLKLISFYADDPPLVALLKSSVGGLEESDLAKIRKRYPRKFGKSFKDCVDDYEIHGEDEVIKTKLKLFREYFEKIRLLAEFKGAGEILTEVMVEKGLDLEISAMPLGAIRLKRAERFISESVQGGKNLSVSDFLKRIEDAPETLTMPLSANDNTVRVMTIHASKGLEFPIVILAGMNKQFNFIDSTGEIATSRSKGIALKSYDETSMTYHSTIARSYIKKAERISSTKEEMRLLYVAMTRAQSRLHLVSAKPIENRLYKSGFLSAIRYADFISPEDFKTVVHPIEELSRAATTKPQSVLIGQGRKSLSDKIYEDLVFSYPYLNSTTLPVKEAVTKIVEENKASEKDFSLLSPVLPNDARTPVSTTVGTIYHRFMEKCDFYGESVEEQLKKMVATNALTAKEANDIDVERLNKTLSSELFADIKGFELYKEQPFIAFFKANEIKSAESDDKILVQGIIDLLAVKDNEAIIIDYKTSSSSIKALALRYKTQLDVYAAAVEKSLGLKVKGEYLLNLLTGEFIKI